VTVRAVAAVIAVAAGSATQYDVIAAVFDAAAAMVVHAMQKHKQSDLHT
jgi:hypothetical protein